MHLFLTIGILLITTFPSLDASRGKLIITITGCKNNKGDIKYIIFNKAEGFPSNTQKCFKRGSIQIKERRSLIVLDEIPFGQYAISILHDENNNEKMDFNLLGMPKEGYGVSNDANRTFGPPKYDEAKIVLNESSKTILINLVYW